MLPVLAAGAIGLNGVAGLANTYFQFKNLEYQKDIQNKIFNREDNSVQRRVADLKAAGLSPVLAAGQGAQAGPVVKTEAPQFDTSHVSNAVSAMQMANYVKQMEAIDADISKTHAEQTAVEMQARKTRADAYSQEMNNAYQEKRVFRRMFLYLLKYFVMLFLLWIMRAKLLRGLLLLKMRIKCRLALTNTELNKVRCIMRRRRFSKSRRGYSGFKKRRIKRRSKTIRKYGVSRGGVRL